MSGIKLTIIGGGAFRTPRLVYGLIKHAEDLHIDQIDLYDPDFPRMTSLLAVSQHVADKLKSPIVMTARASLDDALKGADFVFLTYRVGGEVARAEDERTALDLGVLGQETVGPGGFFMALRSIPVTLEYIDRIRTVAPNAWIINFTNPAGIVTEAAVRAGERRFVGVCDTPYHLQLELAEYLGVNADDMAVESIGLNHLGWFTRVSHKGQDVMPTFMDDVERLRRHIRPLSFFTADEIRRFEGLPTEYVYFYLHAEEVVSRTRTSPTRGERLQEAMQEFFPQLQRQVEGGAIEEAWALYGQTITGRSNSYLASETGSQFERGLDAESLFESEGYEGVAIRVMAGILGETTARAIINVPSAGLLPDLDDNAVIECSSEIRGGTITPVPLSTPVSAACLELIYQTKRFEEATVEAARTGRIEDAATALFHHPVLQGDRSLAARLVEERRQRTGAPAWLR